MDESRSKRSTQRQPLACRACTKSKVRCDKKVPCSRCCQRQIECQREDVNISVKGRRRLRARPAPKIVESVSKDSGDYSTLDETSPSQPYVLVIRKSYGVDGHRDPQFDDLATCIEGLAWGRHQCLRYPHRRCVRFDNVDDGGTSTFDRLDILLKLPDQSVARQMMDFHFHWLAWHHNVLHVPTFLAQCEDFWNGSVIEDGQWLAVYCSVLSAAAWSMSNSPTSASAFHDLQDNELASTLYELMIEILNSEAYMSRHTIHSLQAICISGMVGNVLGQSDLLTTMVSSAIRVAQCLGLHRIQADIPEETTDDIIDKEVGRRVWWKLVEMDYHSMPYAGTYSINPRHMTTHLPLNCNDDDLREQSETQVTLSTFCLVMTKLSLLIPTLLDGLCSIEESGARYEHVIGIDRQMRALVTRIPSAIVRHQQLMPDEPEWLTLARHTLAIAAADKIIMIHRSFLLESFQSPAYLYTRTTCVSAALTILRAHSQLYAPQSRLPRVWIHSAFCVTAIVVICLNLLYCPGTLSETKRQQFVQLIKDARVRLDQTVSDTMARRGVYLIDAMLDDQISTQPHFTRILQGFLQREKPTSRPTSAQMTNLYATDDQFEDFDMWYANMFGQFAQADFNGPINWEV